MKKSLKFLLLVVLMFGLVACANEEQEEANETEPTEQTEAEVTEPVVSNWINVNDLAVNVDNPQVEIYMEGHGTITVELFPEYAPITVEHFLNLVEDSFYDGLTLHRIISGFMMQGGCPYGQGIGGSGQTIVGEFVNNGIDNPIMHTPGVLSMARAQDMNGASSQFFIMHGNASHLDGVHAAFGRVTEGMDVVEAIIASVTPIDNNGSLAPEDHPVIGHMRVVE